eukprot:tig00000073_g1685.t1
MAAVAPALPRSGSILGGKVVVKGRLKKHYDYDPDVEVLRSHETVGAWGHLYRRAELVAFQILFYLTDRTGKAHGPFSRFVLPYLFIIYDFLQLIGLSILNGFPPSSVAWIMYPANAESMIGKSNPMVVFWIVCALICVMFALTGLVFYMSVTQSVRVQPLRWLRFLAQVLVDAAFIPATQVLAGPAACFLASHTEPGGVVARSVTGAAECAAFGGPLDALYFAVSLALLVPFIAYSLLFSLMSARSP